MAYQTINPFTEELVKSFNEHTDAQLEAIIATAEDTYENDWSLRSLAERKAIVKKAASIMREKLDDFAEPITLEMGKLFREAQGEVELSADILDYYADNAEKFLAPQKLKVHGARRLSRTRRWAALLRPTMEFPGLPIGARRGTEPDDGQYPDREACVECAAVRPGV